MIYHRFKDCDLSALGMGCMRLPTLDGCDTLIDTAQVQQMVDCAIDHGINYFDTAWGYHGGHSENVIGAALHRHPRDRYYLATKWPGYGLRNFGHVEEIFNKQLEKTGMEYLDFYLLHNVIETNIDSYLDDSRYHTVSYLLEQREQGRIRHLGFSCHGEFDTLVRFMDAWGSEMEFAQIQLNYQDWNFQDAGCKVAWLNEQDMPIIAMEPLRGGHLVNLTDSERAGLDRVHPGMTPAEWGYRYAQSTPGVMLTLSGMSDLEQCKENVAIFETEIPFGDKERDALHALAATWIERDMVPCTGCRYCVQGCPAKLDIPYLIFLYNERLSKDDERWLAIMKLDALPEEKLPGQCIACGQCASVCPQHIPVPEILDKLIEAVS